MEKRQFRDPYADWWDKQQRRNFGEPVHEDEDILGTFSPEEYTWTTPGKGALMLLGFGGVVATLLFTVGMTYPDKPSAPREFENGLSRELGGDRAVRVSRTLLFPRDDMANTDGQARKEGEGQWRKKVDLEES